MNAHAASPTRSTKTPKKHAKSEYMMAYGVYVLIFAAFVSVCTIAIVLTSSQEANKTGFKAITTKTPTAFFDKTYMKKEPPENTAQP
jgi:hypothetical protein